MNLRKEVSKALLKRGYVHDGRMHLKRLTDDASWVVDTGPLGKERDISPFVGVRHQSLERLVFHLLGLPLDEWSASVGGNVGYLLDGEFRTWIPPSTASDVLDAITLAQERLLPHLSIESVPAIWKLARVKDPGWRYREIAILVLTREFAEIPARLDEAQAEFCRYEDEVCEQFRDFAQRVRDQIAVENS